jgi:hypothetical protein
MQHTHPLRDLLEDAARARFPAPDGSVQVLPAPPGRSDAVVAFTAHHVIAAGVDPDETRAQLPPGDLGAPMSAGFLSWLGRRLGSAPGSVDVVLTASGTSSADADPRLHEVLGVAHDRVTRAQRYREDLSIYADPKQTAVVVLGRGLARRREVSIEIHDEGARSRGSGRDLLMAARALIPDDEYIFAQVASGNAASLRAFLAAGFTPIGSEVLFLRGPV